MAAMDSSVLGYSHWTFADQPTEDQFPSYMMARRLAPLAAAGALPPLATAPAAAPTAPEGASRLRSMLSAQPRGVVPRGHKFVAKLTAPSGGAPEYFGPCDDEAEAAGWYEVASSELQRKGRVQPDGGQGLPEGPRAAPVADAPAQGPGAGGDPPASASRPRMRLFEHLDELLVDEPPQIVPRRATVVAEGKLDSPASAQEAAAADHAPVQGVQVAVPAAGSGSEAASVPAKGPKRSETKRLCARPAGAREGSPRCGAHVWPARPVLTQTTPW